MHSGAHTFMHTHNIQTRVHTHKIHTLVHTHKIQTRVHTRFKPISLTLATLLNLFYVTMFRTTDTHPFVLQTNGGNTNMIDKTTHTYNTYITSSLEHA
jgi:hypothetical protein